MVLVNLYSTPFLSVYTCTRDTVFWHSRVILLISSWFCWGGLVISKNRYLRISAGRYKFLIENISYCLSKTKTCWTLSRVCVDSTPWSFPWLCLCISKTATSMHLWNVFFFSVRDMLSLKNMRWACWETIIAITGLCVGDHRRSSCSIGCLHTPRLRAVVHSMVRKYSKFTKNKVNSFTPITSSRFSS